MDKKFKTLYKILLIMLIALMSTTATFAASNNSEINAKRIPIFVYHRFCTEKEYKQIKSARSLSISNKRFNEQMKFLHDKGYRTISMKEFQQWYDGEIKLPRKSVMITIDDGKYSAVKYALPILEKYGQKATTFVIGNRVKETTDTTPGKENVGGIGFDLINEIKKDRPNFDIQSHTYSFHKWDENDTPNIYHYSYDQCYADLAKQHQMFGFEYLAYPFGAYTNSMISAIKAEGSIKIAFTYGNNRYATRGQERYEIQRIKVNGKEDLSHFTAWLDDGAPTLQSLQSDYNEENPKCLDNTITFASIKDVKYVIMRKRLFGWDEIGSVVGEPESTSYTDKSCKMKRYRYSVKREYTDDDGSARYTPFNKKGLKVLTKHVEPEVEYTNLKNIITFRRNIGVDGYRIFRRVPEGEFEFVKDKNQRKWPTITGSDVFNETCLEEPYLSRITFKKFVDPSYDDFIYSVRSFVQDKDNGITILGPMDMEGEFSMSKPTVVSVKKTSPTTASFRFAVVPHARKYYMYSGHIYDDEIKWGKIAEATGNGDGATITQNVNIGEGDEYFTVRAVFKKNGEYVLSDFETDYNIKDRDYDDKRILVIGASSSYGCPYKKITKRFVFSYPYRMADLMGADIVNVSIPGATYSTASDKRSSVYTDEVLKVEAGEEIDKSSYGMDVLDRNLNKYDLTDFDIIIMAAGGNDYNVNLEPGEVDSRDTNDFTGAVNVIMDKIGQASDKRVAEGKDRTVLLMVSTTYSNRRGNFSELHNRYETKNYAGYTLQDFKDAFEKIYEMRSNENITTYLINSDEYLNSANCSYATTDNLHMNRWTNAAFGAYMAREFVKNEGK